MSGFGTQPFGTSPFGTGGPGTGGGPLVATVEADHVPPRVRLDVTDSAGLSSVTITRLDPDSVYRKVRTSDDQPLPLSGGLATVYDYEAPFGYPVTYSTDQAGSPSVTVQVDSPRPWLIHLGVPSRSVSPVHMLPGTDDAEDWDIDQGVFQVLEREDPIVGTSGARLLPSSRLVVYSPTATDKAALRGLLSDGSPLLLNVPPSLGWGIDTCYIAVGRVTVSRPSPLLVHVQRSIELPYQQISRPAGGTQAWITWDDVATRSGDDYTAATGSTYATWDDVAAAVGSWAELAAPTS